MGADVVTLPPDTLDKMIRHPLTDRGLDLFLNDWKKLVKEHPDIKF
jgi:transaldolase